MAEWKEDIIPGIPIENVAISTDNRIVAISSNHCITLCFSNSTAQPISVECSSPVVSILFTSPEEFITVSSDGELTKWELVSDEIIKRNTRRVTAFPVKNVVWSFSKKHSAWVTEGSDSEKIDTLSVLMKDQTLEKIDTIPSNLLKEQLAITDTYIVYCYGKNIVKLCLDSESDAEKREQFEYKSSLAGLSKDQNEKNVFVRIAALENTVVASLSIGKVYIWNNLNTKKLSLSGTYSLHWHKISAPMAITPFGNLISAGAETVMCKWSLKSTGPPSLLTRLQSAVTRVILSEDGSQAVLLMEDNSLYIAMLSTMTLLCKIPSITFSKRCKQSIFSSDPLTPNMFVMNGTPGWMQWVNIIEKKTARQACLSLENVVEGDMSEIREEVQTFHQLEEVFLSKNSVVSLESLVNFTDEHRRLRFWKRISEHDGEVLNTFSVPVDTIFISGCQQPVPDNDEVYITCTNSGSIDVWHQNEAKTLWFKDTSRCVSNWQNTKIIAASSITPGGFWASAHQGVSGINILVWNIEKLKILEAFRVDEGFNSLEWATSHYLIITSSKSVACWNINTLSHKWTVEQPLKCHISEIGCFGYENDHVIEFDPESSRVLKSLRFSSNIDDIVAVSFKNSVALVAKTAKGLAMMKCCSADVDEVPEVKHKTPFSKLSSTQPAESIKLPRSKIVSSQSVLKILEAPCHSLPPLSHIAPLFISSCLAPPCNAQ